MILAMPPGQSVTQVANPCGHEYDDRFGINEWMRLFDHHTSSFLALCNMMCTAQGLLTSKLHLHNISSTHIGMVFHEP